MIELEPTFGKNIENDSPPPSEQINTERESSEVYKEEQGQGKKEDPIKKPRKVSLEQEDFKSITDNMRCNLVSQEESHQKTWEPVKEKDSYQKRLLEYYEICPKDLIYFDVLNKELFMAQAKKHLEKLIIENQLSSTLRWSEEETERMFGKGLNPTSLITSLESIHWFRENLEMKEETQNIVELGMGAGWATVMLFNNLKEQFGEKAFKQFSVDSSAHAIASTGALLEYSNIPYIVCSNPEDLEMYYKWLHNTEEGRNFSGIVLVYGEFRDVLKKFDDNTINGIYSSHGTAYLSRSEYEELINESSEVLIDGGILIADSLNPLYTNKLDPLLTLSQILSPDSSKKLLDAKKINYIFSKEELKNNSKYFPDQNVKVLKGFNTEHAYLVIRWCNNLLRKLDFNRLVKTIKSLSVTMKVVDDYRADVFPSFLIEDIIRENSIKYEKLNGRPDFPIFMDTQGFKMLKGS